MLYDLSQLSIPSDSVDNDQLLKPKRWDIGYIKRFMFFFGPISSVYDMMTFTLMYYFFHARGNFFQTGWFIESLVTEVLVVFVIRTKQSPFYKSKPGTMLMITCATVIGVALLLPYSGIGTYFQLVPLPPVFFLFLLILISTYLLFVELGKRYVNKKQFESEEL
jgi:Mg2+-importing ATPase